MKLLINREKLIKALSELSSILKENNIRPVISGTKIQAHNGVVKLTGPTFEWFLHFQMKQS